MKADFSSDLTKLRTETIILQSKMENGFKELTSGLKQAHSDLGRGMELTSAIWLKKVLRDFTIQKKLHQPICAPFSIIFSPFCMLECTDYLKYMKEINRFVESKNVLEKQLGIKKWEEFKYVAYVHLYFAGPRP